MSEDYRVGCWAKIERAEEHIQNLRSAAARFFATDPKPYRIVRETKKEGRAYDWLGYEERPPPLRFAVIAGEAIHQLRSSLDQLVVAMVRARGNTISARHGFPITKKPKKFKEAINRGVIKGISLAAQNLIERRQPYNTGNSDTSVLWTLHSNDIEDKHRLLMVVAASVFMEAMTVGTAGGQTNYDMRMFGIRRLLKEGVGLAHIAVGEAGGDFDPEAKFSPLIAFEEFGTIKLLPVIPALVQARDVVLATIREFDGEF
jgi:hypothetical protein